MKTFLKMNPSVLLAAVTFMWLCAVSSVGAEEDIRLVEGAMILAPTTTGTLAAMADGSDDTLIDCVTRIPAQTSPQQRLMAQNICQQEEATRQVVPLGRKEGD